MTTSAIDRPIDIVQDVLQGKASASGWYSARCPAHGDSKASLSYKETEDGGVVLNCHTGCTRPEIVQALGLSEKMLHVVGDYRPAYRARPKLDIIELAADKLLPWQHLFNLGLEDDYEFRSKYGVQKCVKIPYYTQDGEEYSKVRVRLDLIGKKGSFWDDDTPGPLIPYGLHKLFMAREQGYLLIGEGESDAWTCWLHNIPYLGIPGASNTGCFDASGLGEQIKKIYIIQEPDKAGKEFYKKLHKQLRATGYKGEIFQLEFKKVTTLKAKDPNDLHKKLCADKRITDFKTELAAALAQAVTSGDEIDRERPPRPKPNVFRLCDLQKEVLPVLKWAIPDILPEGLSILGGKPKLGKSWLLLYMMLAIACGGVTLGNVPVEEGEVLYISLEDNKRRLQSRANKLQRQLEASPNFYCALAWPRLNCGGLEALEDWIQEHPRCKLIGIDTWARIKPKMQQGNKQQYDEDYDALTPLQELAGKYNVSIVIVHHLRKQEAEDPLDGISGSAAMQGAVDGFLLLYRKRGEDDARLFIDGRDIEETQELMLAFEHETCTWRIKGDADEMAGTFEQQTILDALKPYDVGLTLKQLCSYLDNKNPNTTRNLLVKLRNSKKVSLKGNVYCVVTHSNHSKCSKDSNHSNPVAMSVDAEGNEPDTGLSTYYADASTVVTPTNLVNPLENCPKKIDKTSLTTLTTVTIDALEKAIVTLPDEVQTQLRSIQAAYKDRLFWALERSEHQNGSVPVARWVANWIQAYTASDAVLRDNALEYLTSKLNGSIRASR